MPTLLINAPPVGNVSIPYEEVSPSPMEGSTIDHYQARRTFILDWKRRWTFCAGMMGWSYVRSSGNWFRSNARDFDGQWRGVDMSWNVSRIIPQGYAASDLDPAIWLYPSDIVSMKGEGRILSYDAGGVAQYSKVRVTLGYGTLSYKPRSDTDRENRYVLDANGNKSTFVDESFLSRYVTVFRSPNVEYVTLPLGTRQYVEPPSQFDNSGDPILPKCSGSLGTTIPNVEVAVVWHQVPSLPLALNHYVGTINAFFEPHTGSLAGTLLLTSINVRPYRWFFNQLMYDITYKMRKFEAPLSPGVPNTDANGDPIKAISEGHNQYLRSFSDGTPPRYQLISNDGVQPPDPSTTLPVGLVSVPSPSSGNTPYLHTNFRALFFPSAPPGIPL